jgi:hypothetical protein
MALMNVNTIGNTQFTQSEWFVAKITSISATPSVPAGSVTGTGALWAPGDSNKLVWDGSGNNYLMWNQEGADTGCSGYAHGWIEQRVCANGLNYEDADEASAEDDGSLTSPAYPIGIDKATVGDLVLMRTRGIDTSGNTIYEFIPKGGTGGGGGGGTGYVTSVQCTGGYLIVTYD